MAVRKPKPPPRIDPRGNLARNVTPAPAPRRIDPRGNLARNVKPIYGPTNLGRGNLALHMQSAKRVIPAAGGSYYVYPGGRRTFVPAKRKNPYATASPRGNIRPQTTIDPATGGAVAPGETPDEQAGLDPLTGPAMDAQYLALKAQGIFNLNQGLSQNVAQGETNTMARQQAIRNLQQQQPKDIQSAQEAANRAGLFYSGALGKQEGEINTGYAQSRGDVENKFAAAERARLAARQALEAGFGIDDAAALAEAADRAIGRNTEAADAGALVRETQPKAPTAVAGAPTARTPRARIGKPATARSRRRSRRVQTVSAPRRNPRGFVSTGERVAAGLAARQQARRPRRISPRGNLARNVKPRRPRRR